MEAGINDVIKSLLQDPYALETVWISLITFAGQRKVFTPLEELSTRQLQNLPILAKNSSGCLNELIFLLTQDFVETTPEAKGDWKPIIILFSDLTVTEDIRPAILEWQKNWKKFTHMIAFSLGDSNNFRTLRELTENVFTGEKVSSLTSVFKWFTAPIRSSILSNPTSTDFEQVALSNDIISSNDVNRLPVYLLLDTSSSMKGEPIESVKVAFEAIVSAFQQDLFASKSAQISIITFDENVKEILPLRTLENLIFPEITIPLNGPTNLAVALEMLCLKVDYEIISGKKAEWMPLVFIMTHGSPSDLQKYREMIPQVKKLSFGNIVACATSPKAKDEMLLELTPHVVHLDTTDSSTFSQLFKWVSASLSSGSMSVGTGGELPLPPPPPEVHVVI